LKLITERKSLIKQQILIYKTHVYSPVNGRITHQKQHVTSYIDKYKNPRIKLNWAFQHSELENLLVRVWCIETACNN